MSDDAWQADQVPVPPLYSLASEVRSVLVAWLKKGGNSEYESDRLHYGADLSPDGCQRKTWYRIHDSETDPPSLGDEIRFEGGRHAEDLFAEALENSGIKIRRQVLVKPLRPSAWCWSPGHADILDVERKHLYEVKAPRAANFHRAKGDARRLVKLSYMYQLSAYFHELRRVGLADTASWVFLDREGSNEPQEVPLTPELTIPLEEIIAQEVARAPLITRDTPPDRASGALEVRVWKGTKKTGRRMETVQRRYWGCSYCAFTNTCQPGPEEQPGVATEVQGKEAMAKAEKAWSEGSKTTPQIVRFGAEDEEGSLPWEDQVQQSTTGNVPEAEPGGVSSEAEGLGGEAPLSTSEPSQSSASPNLNSVAGAGESLTNTPPGAPENGISPAPAVSKVRLRICKICGQEDSMHVQGSPEHEFKLLRKSRARKTPLSEAVVGQLQREAEASARLDKGDGETHVSPDLSVMKPGDDGAIMAEAKDGKLIFDDEAYKDSPSGGW